MNFQDLLYDIEAPIFRTLGEVPSADQIAVKERWITRDGTIAADPTVAELRVVPLVRSIGIHKHVNTVSADSAICLSLFIFGNETNY